MLAESLGSVNKMLVGTSYSKERNRETVKEAWWEIALARQAHQMTQGSAALEEAGML
jgi:hypothetical protein